MPRRLLHRFETLKGWRRRVVLLGAVALFAAALLALRPEIVERAARPFGDLKYRVFDRVRAAPEPAVVVVEIDEASIDAYGRWPWSRTRFAQLIDALAPAALVGLDITFSEPNTPADDAALAEAMRRSGNVVAGFFLRTGEGPRAVADPVALDACALVDVELVGDRSGLPELPRVEANVEPFASAALTCAAFNSFPDSDGLIRHYPLVLAHRGRVFPSLAVQLVRYATDREPVVVVSAKGLDRFELGAQRLAGTAYLRVAFDASVTTISARDLLEGRIDPALIAGRIVIVGVTEIGVGDIRATPIDPLLPGVFVHAQVVADLIQGAALVERRDLQWLLAALGLLAVAACGVPRGFGVRSAGYLATMGAQVAVGWGLFLGPRIWVEELYLVLPVLLGALAQEIDTLLRSEANVREMRRALTAYVAPEVVKEILAHPELMELGGEERELTVLFSDVRGFTQRAETIAPRELVSLLNELFEPLTRAIFEERGTLDKYIGDAVMALYNAPQLTPDHAARACATALRFVSAVDELNLRLAGRGLAPLELGVGLNTGLAVVGNMGSSIRFSYTAMGDAVNVASRLEALTRHYGVRIIVSDSTRSQAGPGFVYRELDLVQPKGRAHAVRIFELTAADQPEVFASYAEGLARYRAGEFEAAERILSGLAERSGDLPSAELAARAAAYKVNPPAPDWGGVRKMEEK